MSNKVIYSNDHKELVKKLKTTREKLGLSQVEVAQLLDRSQSYVSKIESGLTRIDIVELSTFSKLYKKNINYFLPKQIK